MTNNDPKLEWLKTQTRNAAILQFAISAIAFFCFVILRPPIHDWRYYIVFFVGGVCGIVIDKRITTKGLGLPSPLVMVPIYHKEPLKVTKIESVTYLMPFWKHFPRVFYVIANIPYIFILGVIVLWARRQGFTFNYAAWAFFFGFVSNVGLSDGAFFTYVVFTWKKYANNSTNPKTF